MKIKSGDKVIVLSGRNKGKTGEVTKVLPKTEKIIVDGINMVKRHTKPSAQNPQGGISEIEAALHISKVALLDPDTNKASRVGYKFENGKKIRISKQSGKEI